MSAESLSPEERLLRLIRKRWTKKEETLLPGKGPLLPPASSDAIPERGFGHLFGKKKEKGAPLFVLAGKDLLGTIRRANQAMAVGLGILLLLFLTTVFGGKWRTDPSPLSRKDRAEQGAERRKEGGNLSEPSAARKPYSYYGSEIEKRNLFGPSLYTVDSAASPGELEALKASVKDLNLLGIISGKTPQAIIEDKKEGKTHFVNEGDRIDSLEVEEITENKVILSSGGEQIDLVL